MTMNKKNYFPQYIEMPCGTERDKNGKLLDPFDETTLVKCRTLAEYREQEQLCKDIEQKWKERI